MTAQSLRMGMVSLNLVAQLPDHLIETVPIDQYPPKAEVLTVAKASPVHH